MPVRRRRQRGKLQPPLWQASWGRRSCVPCQIARRVLQPHLARPDDVPRRKITEHQRRIALLHALAHIELNAIDLAFDILARFAISDPSPLQTSSLTGFPSRTMSEHFLMLADRLEELTATMVPFPPMTGYGRPARTSMTCLPSCHCAPGAGGPGSRRHTGNDQQTEIGEG